VRFEWEYCLNYYAFAHGSSKLPMICKPQILNGILIIGHSIDIVYILFLLAVHRILESNNRELRGFYAELQKYLQGLSDEVAIGALAVVTGRLNTLLRNVIKPLMLKKEQYISC